MLCNWILEEIIFATWSDNFLITMIFSRFSSSRTEENFSIAIFIRDLSLTYFHDNFPIPAI